MFEHENENLNQDPMANSNYWNLNFYYDESGSIITMAHLKKIYFCFVGQWNPTAHLHIKKF